MRRTQALIAVALAVSQNPTERQWGYQLSRVTGLRSGVLYPLLQRLLDADWVTDGWENIDPAIERRPARRYYQLTELGAAELGAIAAAAPAGGSLRGLQVGIA